MQQLEGQFMSVLLHDFSLPYFTVLYQCIVISRIYIRSFKWFNQRMQRVLRRAEFADGWRASHQRKHLSPQTCKDRQQTATKRLAEAVQSPSLSSSSQNLKADLLAFMYALTAAKSSGTAGCMKEQPVVGRVRFEGEAEVFERKTEVIERLGH